MNIDHQTNVYAHGRTVADKLAAAEALADALDRIMEYAHLGASCCDIDSNEQPQFLAARAALAQWKATK